MKITSSTMAFGTFIGHARERTRSKRETVKQLDFVRWSNIRQFLLSCLIQTALIPQLVAPMMSDSQLSPANATSTGLEPQFAGSPGISPGPVSWGIGMQKSQAHCLVVQLALSDMVGKIGLFASIKNYIVGATITALILLAIMLTIMLILGLIM